MRLIDADELKRLRYSIDEDTEVVEVADIDNAPTIEAEPIKHGRWIEDFVEYECSVCGGRISDSTLADNLKPNYCPNCGAIMDEVEE